MYAAVIDHDLIIPYCYGGNENLTGVYFGWKRIGEHWFSRFTWLNREFSGFAFLKQDSIETVSGAWWYDEGSSQSPTAPPDTTGVKAILVRQHAVVTPPWAIRFFEDVKREGLASRLTWR